MSTDKRFLATLIFEHSARSFGAAARLYRVSSRVREWWAGPKTPRDGETWTWSTVKYCLDAIVNKRQMTIENCVYEASRHADRALVKLLLNASSTSLQQRATYVAIRGNNLDIVKMLFRFMHSDEKETCLLLACSLGHVDIVSFILVNYNNTIHDARILATSVRSGNRTLIALLAARSHENTAHAVFHAIADVRSTYPNDASLLEFVIACTSPDFQQILKEAYLHRNHSMVRFAVERGATSEQQP